MMRRFSLLVLFAYLELRTQLAVMCGGVEPCPILELLDAGLLTLSRFNTVSALALAVLLCVPEVSVVRLVLAKLGLLLPRCDTGL